MIDSSTIKKKMLVLIFRSIFYINFSFPKLNIIIFNLITINMELNEKINKNGLKFLIYFAYMGDSDANYEIMVNRFVGAWSSNQHTHTKTHQ